MRYNQTLIASLEEEQVIAEAIVDSEARASGIIELNNADSAESTMLEISNQIFECNEHTRQLEEANKTTEVLNDYSNVLSDIEGQGGLSTESLQILNIGLKHCYKQAGLPNVSMAMESYASRKDLTTAAMESIGEKISAVVTAIIEAIKRGVQWMVDFFKGLFNATKKQQIRAANLRKLTQSIITDPDQNIDNAGHISSKLSMGGHVDVVNATDVIDKYLKRISMPMYTDVTKIVNMLGKSITDDKAGSHLGSAMGAVVSSMRTISNLSFNGNVLPGELDFKIDSDGIKKNLASADKVDLVNDHHLLRTKLNQFSTHLGSAVAAAKSSISFTSTDKPDSVKTLPVLNNANITNTLTNVESILKEINLFETEGKKLERECKYILAKSTIVNGITKLDAMDFLSAVRTSILRIASQFLALANSITAQSVAISLGVSKAALDYCEKSLKKASNKSFSSSTAMVPA